MNLRVESYPGRVIYFDSNFEVAGIKGISEISLVENIFEGFDKSVISIRVHPHISTERTHIYRNHGFYEDLNYNIPWELMLCSNIIGEEKILVSPFSSAMLNPKMLYDKEPKIIMLGKAIKMILTVKNGRLCFGLQICRNCMMKFITSTIIKNE